MRALVIGGLGATELLIILAVLVLLFGASKLPELARGSGRALRIFKAEPKGLTDGEEPAALVDPVGPPVAEPVVEPVVEPIVEPVARRVHRVRPASEATDEL